MDQGKVFEPSIHVNSHRLVTPELDRIESQIPKLMDLTAIFLAALIDAHPFSSDLFTFSLKDADSTPNLPVSSCVMTRCTIDGKEVIRPYTPINQFEKGVLNLLIKYYPNGNMSKHIHGLKVGDTLEIKGPMPKVRFDAH